MNLQSTSRVEVKNPAKTHQKASQIVPRKFLGWLARRWRSAPACQPVETPSPFPFAPGVIDGPVPGPKGNLLTDLIASVIALGAVAAVVGFATGYLSLGVF